MHDLREELRSGLRGRVCLVGAGSADCGDDALGVRLAEALRARFGERFEVLIAGDELERCLPRLAGGGFDTVLFLDAVDFGGAPGSVVYLDSAEIAARFPQVSTHRIGIGVLAKMIEAAGGTRVRLLGVQPESLGKAPSLTPVVRDTLGLLLELFEGVLAGIEPAEIVT